MIFMTHPKHGAMNVYSPVEATEAKKNGWVESTPEKWLASKPGSVDAPEQAEEVAEPQEDAPVERKKPGRKPKA